MDLQVQTQEIQHILSMIGEIASTSNILSLNAMIEASNAGDAGESFAVVADNMANLANNTRNATKETVGISTAIQEHLQNVLENVKEQYEAVLTGAGKITSIGKLISSLVDDKANSGHPIQGQNSTLV